MRRVSIQVKELDYIEWVKAADADGRSLSNWISWRCNQGGQALGSPPLAEATSGAKLRTLKAQAADILMKYGDQSG